MFKADNSEREVNMDTFYTLPLVEGLSNTLLLQDQGFYHFTLDAAQPSGFTLFQFTSAYPYVTSSMQMLMPLRYITSGNEFKSIFESKDKKKAVDDFWVKIAGDEARAKSLIKLYYNRVQNANICFTSDKEGWMTDRGMVYIVFGAPNIVYRDSEMETWKYGSTQSNQSITFNFYRADNPFTNNEFTLDRSQNYSINWNNAIEVWRR
jgi:GWxTD domain-containing protein